MITADSDRNEVGEKRAPRRPLRSLFQPRTVAVIGATERPGSVGRSVVVNLTAAKFGGTIVGVNPKYATVLGLACFPSIGAVPQHVDLAVIATPAATVPQLIDACVAARVDAAIVVSGGFKEVGPEGAALEREVVTRAHHRLRLLGPNCLGLMSPATGLNATFAKTMALAGSIGFASQSGALCTAILDWSLAQGFGFSYVQLAPPGREKSMWTITPIRSRSFGRRKPTISLKSHTCACNADINRNSGSYVYNTTSKIV